MGMDSEDVNCVKMDALVALFPNVKVFEIKCPVLHSFLFDSIVKLLEDELIEEMNAQIEQIIFKWVNSDNLDAIIEQYSEILDANGWRIEKKHKYGFDYLTIQKQPPEEILV